MTAHDLQRFEIGHWVIVANGPYAGRRAQIVGRDRDRLRLLVNGGPRQPVRLGVSDVRRETVGRQPQIRPPVSVLDRRRPEEESARPSRLPWFIRSIFGGAAS
jgi:hypothetical protein